MTNIPIFYINLDRCLSRNENIIKELNKFNCLYERISGVDMNMITDICEGETYSINFDKTIWFKQNNYKMIKKDNKRYILINNKIIKCNSEMYKSVAIVLSMFKVFTRISELNHEICVIMEDYVSFKYIKNWNEQINTIIKNAPNDWNIIKLHVSNKEGCESMIELNKQNIMYTKLLSIYGPSAMCYIIKKSAVNKILKRYLHTDNKYHLPFGFENCNNESIVFKLNNIYVYTEPIICSIENNITCKNDINNADLYINKIIEEYWNHKC
jgi:hypothetical protein